MRHKVLACGFPFPAHCSSNSTRKPLTFDWTNDPSTATLDSVVCISGAIESEIGRPGRKIAWVLESPAIAEWQNTTPFIKNNLERVMDAYEFVLSSDREFCQMHPRIIYHPAGANLPWIREDQYAIYRKTRMCSMFASRKKMVETHLIRQRYAEKFKDKLDLFGGAAGSPRIGGNSTHPDKSEGMIPYRFQVVMENCQTDFYYTEKITDCFATGTVPVYWGSDCIGEIFDTDGILIMGEDFNPDELSEGLYWSIMPAIRNNLEIVRGLEGTDDLLFRKFVQTKGSVAMASSEDCDRLPWADWKLDPLALPEEIPERRDEDHLQIICNEEKNYVSGLQEVPQGLACVRRVRSALEKPRTARPEQQLAEWYPDILDAFLLRLSDAYIGDNVVFDRENFYGFDRWWAGRGRETYQNTKTITRIDSGVLISGWGGSAFQHFILDAVPPLAGVVDLLETPEYEHFKIVTHAGDAKFALWFWDKLGLSERIVQKPENAAEGRVIHARQVLFWHFEPSINSLSVYPRHCLLPVQKRLGIFDTGPQNLVLYLCRPQRDRSVANEEAIVSIMEQELQGSELTLCCYESTANWQQDLETFSRAKIVIGPHGGAFANILFSRPGTHVVEFVSPIKFQGRNSHLVYYGLSQAAGHHYWFTEASGFDIDLPEMSVNEDDVRIILREILNS